VTAYGGTDFKRLRLLPVDPPVFAIAANAQYLCHLRSFSFLSCLVQWMNNWDAGGRTQFLDPYKKIAQR
jgi:hypothetical protein